MSDESQNGNDHNVENGSLGLKMNQNDVLENDKIGRLEFAEETQPGAAFVDPVGDRYDPKTRIE